MKKKHIYIIAATVAFITIIAGVAFIATKGTQSPELAQPALKEDISEGNPMKDYKKNKISLIINNTSITATLKDNAAANELYTKLQNGNITLHLEDYANFEKVGPLGFSLPRDDKQITTTWGDLILYQGNQFVLYYDTNSYTFTKLGHVEDISRDELRKLLGEGDVDITLSK